jgi:hypothetical protein
LTPAAVPAPIQLQLANQDLADGECDAAEVDGTGHVATKFQNDQQGHQTHFSFFDPSGTAAGTYDAVNSTLIGQSSGFMGAECLGAFCQQDVFVLGPTGNQLLKTATTDTSNNVQAGNPTGGMVHVRLPGPSGLGDTALIDSFDDAGGLRWTRAIPDALDPSRMRLGVDRTGATLVLWLGTARFGDGSWAGQWFDPVGNAGPVFKALGAGPDLPGSLFDRVGSGLFVSGEGGGWLGQFDSMSTQLTSVPAWLAARPNVLLHMVHGGTGYAVIPQAGARNPTCQQTIEVVAPDGTSCGTASFAVDAAVCTTSSIIVGYDGTVVQQLPQEREPACTAAGHSCNCTWRSWPGFFR